MEMSNIYVDMAIQSVQQSERTYCKFLSDNDTKATKSHQNGILISTKAKDMLFTEEELAAEGIPSRNIKINWQNELFTSSKFKYYASKSEYRITCFGRDFPFLNEEDAGSLFVLTQQTHDDYSAFILNSEDSIEGFLGELGLSVTELDRVIDLKKLLKENENEAIHNYIQQLDIDFPTTHDMAIAARMLQDKIYDHKELVFTDPDQKILDWTSMEYRLFRAIENDRYKSTINNGFSTIDDFVDFAKTVTNRRKSRAGKSLEKHLSFIFKQNSLRFAEQAITENRNKPDFLFPSRNKYKDMSFPVDKLATLAAKTTCKDRWRQILSEADRLTGRTIFLCTLQQGMSKKLLDEMNDKKVVLVVPKPYIETYPRGYRKRIWTLAQFIKYIREIEK